MTSCASPRAPRSGHGRVRRRLAVTLRPTATAPNGRSSASRLSRVDSARAESEPSGFRGQLSAVVRHEHRPRPDRHGNPVSCPSSISPAPQAVTLHPPHRRLDAVEEAARQPTEMGPAQRSTFRASRSINESRHRLAQHPRRGPRRPSQVSHAAHRSKTADPIVYTVARRDGEESTLAAARRLHRTCLLRHRPAVRLRCRGDGIMTREKPATNFLIGMFYAESLILAETGATTGAIRLPAPTPCPSSRSSSRRATTRSSVRKLYAASAYLSREHCSSAP